MFLESHYKTGGHRRHRPPLQVTLGGVNRKMAEFQDAVPVFEDALKGDWRGRILHELSTTSKNYDEALWRLRTNMRSNAFKAGDQTLNLERVVRRLDNRTVQDGFHVLQDWDGKAEKLNKETIPVDVLDYV